MTIYVVKDNNTLGYLIPGMYATMGVLASGIGGHDWRNGPVSVFGADLREATNEDFERFRVQPPRTNRPPDHLVAISFLRGNGVKITIHHGQDYDGNKGWYWCEAASTTFNGSKYYHDLVYQYGRSGQGPFGTTFEAYQSAMTAEEPKL